MTNYDEFNRQLLGLRFQKLASEEKDALWSMAILFGGNRRRAQTLLTNGLSNAWKSISVFSSATERIDESALRREIYVCLAQTGLRILTGDKPAQAKLQDKNDKHSLLRVSRLRESLPAEELVLLALSQYAKLADEELASIVGLPDDTLHSKIAEARNHAEAILHSNHLAK